MKTFIKYFCAVLLLICPLFLISSNVTSADAVVNEERDGIHYILYSDGTLVVSGKGNCRINGYEDRVKKIIIKEGFTKIVSVANYEKLKSISIPSTVKSIGGDGFYCSALETIVLPYGFKKIGNHSFTGCSRLKKITIPNTVTSIGEFAFFGCTSLKTISLPRSVRTIGPEAFSGSGLRSITIPEGVTKLGAEPFNDCAYLKSVSLPSTLKKMGPLAFGSPLHIKTIKVSKKNRYFSSKNGILFNKKKTKLLVYPARGKTSYTVPKSVKTIGKSAFMDPRLQKINLSSNVRVIGPYAFAYCPQLKKVTLSQKLRIIGDSAFSYIEHLNSVTIPKNVIEIGEGAFEGCSRLKKIKIKTKKLKSNKVGKNAFRWINKKVVVKVPDGKKGLYKSILRKRGVEGRIE